MTPLTPSQKNKIISRLFWDVDVEPVNADALIEKHLENIEDVHSQIFFRKLLVSCDWYTILKIVPAEKLPDILSDQITNGLFPKDLKHRYEYARALLLR